MRSLFMIAGPAGSGKTTTGVALAERLGAATVDLDEVTEVLVAGYRAANPGVDEPTALERLRTERYRELADGVRRLFDSDDDCDVVVIAPFTAEISSPARWAHWRESVGLPAESVHLVWLDLPAQGRLERMAARGAGRDATVLAQATLAESPAPVVPHLRVDARQPVADQVDLIIITFQ